MFRLLGYSVIVMQLKILISARVYELVYPEVGRESTAQSMLWRE